MHYFSDDIKDTYKEWKPTDRIFISTPTGSGKTTFCLETLLPYAVNEGRSILYLVNRKILKAQLETELKETAANLRADGVVSEDPLKYITVQTYQFVEKNNYLPFGYYYIICNEAHYFLADSTYNTNTIVGFEKLACQYSMSSVFIFLSATMNLFKESFLESFPKLTGGGKILEILKNSTNSSADIYYTGYSWPMPPQGLWTIDTYNKAFFSSKSIEEYKGGTDYSYLNIKTFRRPEDLIEKIKEEGTDFKWLIFYNYIEKGKQMAEELTKDGYDAIFLDSDYAEDEDKQRVVSRITEENLVSKDIIITTSILDNGVNIIDKDVRNIVVIADTEEDMVQMLGRRRRKDNNEMLNLYLCGQDMEYFRKRKETYQRLYSSIAKYESAPQYGLANILKSKAFYEDCRRFLTTIYQVKVNIFARAQIKYLYNFYREMYASMKQDRDSFLIEQMKWLSIKEEDARKIIQDSEISKSDRLKRKISDVMEDIISKGPFNKEQNVKYKELFRYDLMELIFVVTGNKVHASANVNKKNEPYTDKKFNEDMASVNLSYRMKKPSRDMYEIYMEKN